MLGCVVFNVSGDFEEAAWGFGSGAQRRGLGSTDTSETCARVERD